SFDVVSIVSIHCRRLGSSLFPYTTLFRSREYQLAVRVHDISDRCCRRTAVRRVNVRGEVPRAHCDGGNKRRCIQRSLACGRALRSEEHTSELQSRENLVCCLLLEMNNEYW